MLFLILFERTAKFNMGIEPSVFGAEFESLGFSCVNESVFQGRIPQEYDIGGFYINVEIFMHDYPLRQPSIRLISIQDNHELYKKIPKSWRHIDEWMMTTNPKESYFHICCLHNWSASSKNNVNFIYTRLIDWLKNNVNEDWKAEDDLPGWRILPQISNSCLYLEKNFVNEIESIEKLSLYEFSTVHSLYKLKNGKFSSANKKGTDYNYENIIFPTRVEEPYYYFEENYQDDKSEYIKNSIINKKNLVSKFNVIRMPITFKFKTTFQLMQSIVLNTAIEKINPDNKNIPFLIMYSGDKGRTEYIAFITNLASISSSGISSIQVINIEIIPETPLGIDKKVGIIGGGSLGSQICKMLAHKHTKSLVVSDFDRLSVSNLGNHELAPYFLGQFKSKSLARQLENITLQRIIPTFTDSSDLFEFCDLLVISVGRKQSFDLLAFKELIVYSKPVIWVWTSPNNILQEIVITTPQTGCLNCYYKLIESDVHLNSLHQQAENEIAKYPSEAIDLCGNPHIVSTWEKMSFLASQVTTIISLYEKHHIFKYDYFNYYWGMDEIMPTHIFGLLEQQPTCFCRGELI